MRRCETLAKQSRGLTRRVAEGEAAEKDDVAQDRFRRAASTAWNSPAARAKISISTLGSGQFIPGFEDQLIGAKAGEQRDVKVTFPADYQAAELAGKDAVFAVTVKEIKAPDDAKIDDELAKKTRVWKIWHAQGPRARSGQSRFHARQPPASEAPHPRCAGRRALLPAAARHGGSEFACIWAQVEAELKREGKTAADEGKTEDELKAEYRDIAERRVRLGLVLGSWASRTASPSPATRSSAPSWRGPASFPGQEQQVFQYYANNPQAQAEIRAPLFEDKVVDFIAELADVTDEDGDRETLFLDPDEAAESCKAAIITLYGFTEIDRVALRSPSLGCSPKSTEIRRP